MGSQYSEKTYLSERPENGHITKANLARIAAAIVIIIQYEKPLAEKKLPQMLAASIVIRSDSGAQISSPILLKGGPFFVFRDDDRPRGEWES